MPVRRLPTGALLALTLALTCFVAVACGDSGTSDSDAPGGSGASGAGTSQGGNGGSGAGVSDGGDGAGFVTDGGGGESNTEGFQVEPQDMQTIVVPIGSQTPTVAFSATFNGNPVAVGWGVNRGDIGSVPAGNAQSAVFTPSGTVGGVVNVRAGLNNQVLERPVLVQLEGSSNGADVNNPELAPQIATNPVQLTQGGGIGGVGGEGLGGAVDAATTTLLDTPTGNGQAENLRFIYPYDNTVWPRGLLAPNLMWKWTTNDADAIKIELSTTTGSFSWSGTYARPAILAQTGGAFVRHPIPQDIWRMATNSAGGADKLTVSLTVARNGQSYGPISQTWTVAPGRLSGVIYYNSYGTQLAKNYDGAIGGDGRFGGAVLGIHVGDTAPYLVAGNNGNATQCRVCHSVAADGSRLVTQRDGGVTSEYTLTPNGAVESALANGAEFPAVYPDGSRMLDAQGRIIPLPNSATPVPASANGLSAISANLVTPMFSPDGTQVVFAMLVSPAFSNATQKLVVADFDAATQMFSSPVVVADYTGSPAQTRPGWPAFLPDGASVVFHKQTAAGIDGNNLYDLRTRKGAKAELVWTDTANPASVTPMNLLNGRDAQGNSYLPIHEGGTNMSCLADNAQVGNIDPTHADDVNTNYEPTVNPISSGGYAWVVFTSRRLYGSVAQIPPYCSDPRGVNLVTNITTKKLWVAAVDLNAQPGTDASHPAFYLPAQELLAGNSRGFWVLDPCKADGEDCETGDQCCNGFCQPDDQGNNICSDQPPNGECSQVQEACDTAADCCDAETVCINGFCAIEGPM